MDQTDGSFASLPPEISDIIAKQLDPSSLKFLALTSRSRYQYYNDKSFIGIDVFKEALVRGYTGQMEFMLSLGFPRFDACISFALKTAPRDSWAPIASLFLNEYLKRKAKSPDHLPLPMFALRALLTLIGRADDLPLLRRALSEIKMERNGVEAIIVGVAPTSSPIQKIEMIRTVSKFSDDSEFGKILATCGLLEEVVNHDLVDLAKFVFTQNAGLPRKDALRTLFNDLKYSTSGFSIYRYVYDELLSRNELKLKHNIQIISDMARRGNANAFKYLFCKFVELLPSQVPDPRTMLHELYSDALNGTNLEILAFLESHGLDPMEISVRDYSLIVSGGMSLEPFPELSERTSFIMRYLDRFLPQTFYSQLTLHDIAQPLGVIVHTGDIDAITFLESKGAFQWRKHLGLVLLWVVKFLDDGGASFRGILRSLEYAVTKIPTKLLYEMVVNEYGMNGKAPLIAHLLAVSLRNRPLLYSDFIFAYHLIRNVVLDIPTWRKMVEMLLASGEFSLMESLIQPYLKVRATAAPCINSAKFIHLVKCLFYSTGIHASESPIWNDAIQAMRETNQGLLAERLQAARSITISVFNMYE